MIINFKFIDFSRQYTLIYKYYKPHILNLKKKKIFLVFSSFTNKLRDKILTNYKM